MLKENKIKILELLSRMQKEQLSKEEYKELQKLLIENEILFREDRIDSIPYPICRTEITGDKIMFVSDTHHGNGQFENKSFTDYAYNTALRENIKTVIHAGDLIESTTAPQHWNENYNDQIVKVRAELEKALKAIPNELQIKLLLGNHDYTTIKRYLQLIPYYINSEKIDVLGMKQVLLNWDDYAKINLEHFTQQLKSPTPEELKKVADEATITLEGHHHYYTYKEDFQSLYLPSLSNDIFNYKDYKSKFLSARGFNTFYPFFVIASKNTETSLIFEAYCVDKENKYAPTKGDTLEVNPKTKKLTIYK